ncbi:MAG: CDP-diacylglycerol--glycerol-3-phosphate 3-phosphatidyltransferase [Thermoguttaceae bacterium]
MTMNVPNFLTMLRVVLAILIFALLPFQLYSLCIILFVLASLSDFLDGYWARKFNQITVFGRIMDPFADKLLICGCFIYLAAIPELTQIRAGLQVWMSILIVARELYVTSLRAVIEKNGGDFSAKWIGKWKMALQCLAVPACLLFLICPQNTPLYLIMVLSVWGTVLITAYSAVSYTNIAIRMIQVRG